MDNGFVIYLGRHTLETALMLSAPVLATCMIVGAVTLICGNWMLQMLLGFTNEIFSYIQNIGH